MIHQIDLTLTKISLSLLNPRKIQLIVIVIFFFSDVNSATHVSWLVGWLWQTQQIAGSAFRQWSQSRWSFLDFFQFGINKTTPSFWKCILLSTLEDSGSSKFWWCKHHPSWQGKIPGNDLFKLTTSFAIASSLPQNPTDFI